MAEVLLPIALCSDADAKAAGAADGTTSSGSPDEWTRKTNAASVAFLNLCGREIVSGDATRAGDGTLTVPESDRVFSVRELIRIGDTPEELELGDAAAIASITLGYADGTSALLGAGDFTALPLRRRYAWEPIEAVELGRNVTWKDRVRDTITITATWGFPAVPEDVREAVARTAAAWFAQDLRRYGQVFSAADATAPADPGTSHVLPRFAWETAMRYRRQRFG